MSQFDGALRAVMLELLLTAAALPATAPDPIYKSLREAPIADAFVVDNIVLKRDVGVITLKSGTIAFTAPALDRETVAIFIGEGEFTLVPATVIEKNYLKTLTEQESIKDSFDRAMFCFTDETAKEIRAQAKTKASESKAADVLKDFRKRLRSEISMENIEATILADLYRAGQPGFFSGYLHGRKHPELQFHVKPRGALLQLSSDEVFAISIQARGVQDQLLYMTHLAAELESGKASSEEDKRIVAAESYQIVTTIAKNDQFTATTKLHFRTLSGGERVIPMELVRTLRVTRVTMDGKEAAFIQEDKREDAAFYVVLPQPLEKDSSHDLVIEYQGDKVVHKAGGGSFSVGARTSWYPNVNSFKDQARYDLTFKVPKQYTLVSVGKLAKEWKEEDLACSQWISEVPLAVAGFNYGTFKKKHSNDNQSGMIIEGYAVSELPDYLKEATEGADAVGTMSPAALTERTMSEAQIAMRIFNSWFGKSVFGRIAITQQPEWSFGQSWPSLVYLPMIAYLDSTQRWRLMGTENQNKITEFVDEVTPHEVAHQWWGHMVGWNSYHDQWISEGFATFSAGLYLQLTNKSPEKYLKYWANARDKMLEKNSFGRRSNDAGPLWMGLRLDSEKNPRAYNDVVYEKGGYVLHMLRQMMFDQKEGDKPFIAMMHDFVAQHMNRNASTEGFQRVVEKHMRPQMNAAGNGKMDWFFSQWVYGTTIPRYKLDYVVTPNADGTFQLKGSVTQSEVSPDFVMVVPIYLEFDTPVFRMGSVRLKGNSTLPIDVQLPKKPKRVLLNANHDVLEQR